MASVNSVWVDNNQFSQGGNSTYALLFIISHKIGTPSKRKIGGGCEFLAKIKILNVVELIQLFCFP